MFKSSRWRSEKNKIKAVFKLQLKATQVPRLGWDSMMVTLVPVDVGKPSMKSEKAVIIDGSCIWLNPIYETVKLNQDQKTGKISDKVYQFIVSAIGSTKSGVLGEININVADYAQVFKASSVSLPLQDSNNGAILHVTIQRVQGDVEGRETVENGEIPRETNEKRGTPMNQQPRTLQSQLSNPEYEDGSRAANGANAINSAEAGSFINSKALVKFHSTRNLLDDNSSGNLRKSSSFDAISASGSESSSGPYTPKENRIKSNNAHQDSASLPSPLSNGDSHQNTVWSVNSETNISGETGLREKAQGSGNTLEKQKSDLDALARQVEVLDLELQTLRKQVVKESRRGQELVRELSSMKEERDAIRKECEELKASKKRAAGSDNIGAKDRWSMLEEMKEELDHEKNLNVNLRLQLQKTQESNSELIFAVRDLEELLEQKNREKPCTHVNSREMECQNQLSNFRNSEVKEESLEMNSCHEEEQCDSDGPLKEHGDTEVAYSQEPRFVDLNSELELYKKDREDLEMQMEQLALDYEILKQENHDTSSRLEQLQLREQLRMQYECSAHLAIINDLEFHVESLEKELEKQAEEYEDNLESVIKAKVEQEQRAIQAEEELRKIKWKNANTVEHLQEEFKSLASRISTTFYANEEMVMSALEDSRELRLEKFHTGALLEKCNKEISSLQHQHQVKCQQLLSLIDFKTKEVDRLLLQLKYKEEELDNQKKSEEVRQKASREEMTTLKSDMELLSRENSSLSEQIEQKEKMAAEIENLKASTKEIEMMLQESNLERDMMGKELSMLKEEAKNSLEELNSLGHLKDEQEATIKALNSKVQTLTTRYSDLKHSLSDDELEKENLKKQVFLLRGDLRKEADIITSIEKRLKDNNANLTISEGAMITNLRNMRKISFQAADGSQMVAVLHENSKCFDANLLNGHNRDMHEDQHETYNGIGQLNAAQLEALYQMQDEIDTKNFKDGKINEVKINGNHLHEEMKQDKEFMNLHENYGERIRSNLDPNAKSVMESLVSCTYDQRKIAEVLSEMEELKERNESMEAELKEMQERYSEMSLRFAEVEGERQQLVIRVRTLKNAMKN